MIRFFPFVFCSLLSSLGFATETVTVYTYDSALGKGSLGEYLKTEIQKQEKIETRFVSFPSAGEVINQLALEGKNTTADLVLGVDDSLLARAKALGVFEKAEAGIWEGIPEALRVDSEGFFVPFDYGYLSLVYDDRRGIPIPSPFSLRALAKEKGLHHRLVIEDPQSSSIGLAFLIWTRLLFEGKQWSLFWNDLWGAIVTVSPGWSGAYGLFLKKGADLVVSYTTSPAYHREKEGSTHYHALIFPEGHYRQVEGAAVLKSSKHRVASRRWLSRLLSAEAQKALPSLQWMYPAKSGVALPASFAGLTEPKALRLDPARIEKERREWVREWTRSSLEPRQ